MNTIDLTPTWTEAAQIIAVALENGTGTGRDMARAELIRMGGILDELRAARPATTLYEVITSKAGRAFGQTFDNEADAEAYAAQMRAAGYAVDPFPEFATATLAQALEIAAQHYGDKRLTTAGKEAGQ